MHYGVYLFLKLTGEHVLFAFLTVRSTGFVLKVVDANFKAHLSVRYTIHIFLIEFWYRVISNSWILFALRC